MGGRFTEKKDSKTNTQVMLDYSHHKIHEGDHFFITNYVTRSAGEFLDIVITAPDTTKHVHMLFSFGVSTMAEILVNEATTNSNNATGVTPLNSNRASTITSGVVVYTGTGCCTNTGSNLMSYKIGLSAGVAKTGAPQDAGREAEIILKQGSGYLVRMTAVSTSSNINYSLLWYEHIGSN